MLVDSVACAVAVRVVDDVGVNEGDAEAADRSRRAMERCTRGAEIVARVLFWTCPFLLSPLRRERSRPNTLAWTRTTRSGARSLLVDLVACALDGAGIEKGDAEAAARSRRAMERCTRGAEVVAKVLFCTCPFATRRSRTTKKTTPTTTPTTSTTTTTTTTATTKKIRSTAARSWRGRWRRCSKQPRRPS